MITIILMEPETSGNVGAVARAMKNFGFSRLVLINPQCDHLDDEAFSRAKHAKDILKKAKVKDKKFLKNFHPLIATTAKLGSDYNIPRSPLTPQELTKMPAKNMAILFGRESIGLINKEINACDFLISIPTKSKYPVLNLSHAVAIILYELQKAEAAKQLARRFTPSSDKEKEQIGRLFNDMLDKVTFSTKDKKNTQRTVWKRIFSKAMLTKREAFAVMGLLKKLR